jgi:AcrR family transcriptional regulator
VSAPNPDRRSERAHQAILDAAIDLCQEMGFVKLTMEGIAKRAGVGKQTIYRWWPSKGAVVQEAMNQRLGAAIDFPDTGDVVADLRTQMAGVAKFLVSPEFAQPLRGLVAAAQDDPEVAKSMLENIFDPRVQACRKRLEQARREGQIRADVDLDDVIEALYGPLYYRLFLGNRPITARQVDDVLDLVFAGLEPRPETA